MGSVGVSKEGFCFEPLVVWFVLSSSSTDCVTGLAGKETKYSVYTLSRSSAGRREMGNPLLDFGGGEISC